MNKGHLEAQDDVRAPNLPVFIATHVIFKWAIAIQHRHISDQILSSVAEVEHAADPGESAEGARRDLREGQQGDEEQPGQGDDNPELGVWDEFNIINLDHLKASVEKC